MVVGFNNINLPSLFRKNEVKQTWFTSFKCVYFSQVFLKNNRIYQFYTNLQAI